MDIKHGVRSSYTNHGCRCDECRAASMEYQREYLARKKSGVPPLRARKAYTYEDRRRSKVRSRYRLTPDEHDLLIQGGCGICRGQVSLSSPVDHDHSCCPGETSCGACVRGVLCARCNVGIARFRDDPETIQAAIRYLG